MPIETPAARPAFSTVYRLLMATICVVSVGLALDRGQALAAGESVFTIRDVPVDATAAGAAQARDIAVDKGRQVAYLLLLKRLTPESAWSLHPQLSPAEVAELGAGFEVVEERNSTTRYIAKLNYSFRPAAIRSLLQRRNVPFSETQAPMMIVFPARTVGGQTDVWSEGNVWREAWAARNFANELTPVIAPLGDLSDLSTAPASLAAQPSFARFAPYAQKYGVSSVLVAEAIQVSPEAGVEVRLTRLTASDVDRLSVSVPAGGDVERTMRAAVDASMGDLQESWKQRTLVPENTGATLTVVAQYATLRDWMRIQQALNTTPSISNIRVRAFSTGEARLDIAHGGTAERLAFILAQKNLSLTPASLGAPVVPQPAAVSGEAGAASLAVEPASVPQEWRLRLRS